MAAKPPREADQEPAKPGLLYIIYLFTRNDILTFVTPQTTFAISGALSHLLGTTDISLSQLVTRLPFVIFFNYSNLLIFDLANQRAPSAVLEDKLNKPHRPIARGFITSDQTRRLMLLLVPCITLVNYYLGVVQETAALSVWTWMYNDLGGGDEFVLRELLLAVAYAIYNHGSLRIALGTGAFGPENTGMINVQGYYWIVFLGVVTFATVQVQDLKDMVGDGSRGRRTIPLVLGEQTSRNMIAFFLLLGSIAGSLYWELELLMAAMVVAGGIYVAYRTLALDGPKEDAKTWKWWYAWMALLYCLPLVKRVCEEGFGKLLASY